MRNQFWAAKSPGSFGLEVIRNDSNDQKMLNMTHSFLTRLLKKDKKNLVQKYKKTIM
jgi:hypothetical protein